MVMVMDMVMVDMATMDMARGLLNLLLLLSLDIFMAMDMVMDTILAMDMVDMDFMDSMARDLLMPSQDMDIMAMDMDTIDMDMAMVMDSMVKQICCSFLEFSTNEVDQTDPVKTNTLFIPLKYIWKIEK